VTAWILNQAKKNCVSQPEIDKLTRLFEKTKQEELRYIKAYGEGLLEPDQFEQVVKEVKQKRKTIESKLAKTNNQPYPSAIGSNEDLLQQLCDESRRVIKEMMSGDKKLLIHDIIDKVIINDESGVEVFAHLAASTQKVGYGTEYRDSRVTGTTNRLSFPFQFRFTLPKSRKDREIILRNHLGQIVMSRVPQVVGCV